MKIGGEQPHSDSGENWLAKPGIQQPLRFTWHQDTTFEIRLSWLNETLGTANWHIVCDLCHLVDRVHIGVSRSQGVYKDTHGSAGSHTNAHVGRLRRHCKENLQKKKKNCNLFVSNHHHPRRRVAVSHTHQQAQRDLVQPWCWSLVCVRSCRELLEKKHSSLQWGWNPLVTYPPPLYGLPLEETRPILSSLGGN